MRKLKKPIGPITPEWLPRRSLKDKLSMMLLQTAALGPSSVEVDGMQYTTGNVLRRLYECAIALHNSPTLTFELYSEAKDLVRYLRWHVGEDVGKTLYAAFWAEERRAEREKRARNARLTREKRIAKSLSISVPAVVEGDARVFR